MTNGISNIGWGMAVLVNNGKKDIPSGNLQGIGRGMDNHTGNENHSFEKAGAIADFAFSLPGGVSGTTKLVERSTDLVSLVSTIETVTDLSQNSTDQTTNQTKSSETTSSSHFENPSFDLKDLIKIEPTQQDNTQPRKLIEPIGYY